MKGMDPESLRFFTLHARRDGYDPETLIFREGQEADRFYLVEKGKVVLGSLAVGRGNISTQIIGPGEALGWSWMFSPYKWNFDARAIDQVQSISFDAVLIREKCHADHHFGFQIVLRMGGIIANRLQATRRQMLEQAGLR